MDTIEGERFLRAKSGNNIVEGERCLRASPTERISY